MADNTVVTSSFTGSREQRDDCSLACCSSGTNNVQTSSDERVLPSYLPGVATSPELVTDSDQLVEWRPSRQRSYSAPTILYQQVALQLRDISDDFNREYSHEEAVADGQRPPQRNRRRSLPVFHRHEPHSPNWLHNMIETYRNRSASNTPPRPRSHNNSISQVPEEMDTEDGR